jgi:hypothetical protein
MSVRWVDIMRWLGVASALVCVLLAAAVFVVLLVVEHYPLAQAAQSALPLVVFALFGAFGAAMTRYMAR